MDSHLKVSTGKHQLTSPSNAMSVLRESTESIGQLSRALRNEDSVQSVVGGSVADGSAGQNEDPTEEESLTSLLAASDSSEEEGGHQVTLEMMNKIAEMSQ